MTEETWLAERFEAQRGRLGAIAYRMLGSTSEADDAVQETWIRLSCTDTDNIENLHGWLTTVVSRVCLNVLQARRGRTGEPLDHPDVDIQMGRPSTDDPEQEAVLAESVGLAMLIVLDQLGPAERVAFVLHDVFGIPFDEIAPIVERSGEATRKLASRARRRIRDGVPPIDPRPQAELVAAFLSAARDGDLAALLQVLDPNVMLRADETAARYGATPELRGPEQIATFYRRAGGARPALVDGAPGAVWMVGDQPRVVFRFTTDRHGITAIDLIADPDALARLQLDQRSSFD